MLLHSIESLNQHSELASTRRTREAPTQGIRKEKKGPWLSRRVLYFGGGRKRPQQHPQDLKLFSFPSLPANRSRNLSCRLVCITKDAGSLIEAGAGGHEEAGASEVVQGQFPLLQAFFLNLSCILDNNGTLSFIWVVIWARRVEGRMDGRFCVGFASCSD